METLQDCKPIRSRFYAVFHGFDGAQVFMGPKTRTAFPPPFRTTMGKGLRLKYCFWEHTTAEGCHIIRHPKPSQNSSIIGAEVRS